MVGTMGGGVDGMKKRLEDLSEIGADCDDLSLGTGYEELVVLSDLCVNLIPLIGCETSCFYRNVYKEEEWKNIEM